MMTRRRSRFISRHRAARPDPMDSEPVSPMKILAGTAFHHRKPRQAPAKIFMGDTGSLSMGSGLAALCLLMNLDLLLVIIGGLFVIETLSVVIQVISFRVFHRRVFLMAPVHHHFELRGWPETTVIVRFWILAGLFAALGLGIFYGDFLSVGKV